MRVWVPGSEDDPTRNEEIKRKIKVEITRGRSRTNRDPRGSRRVKYFVSLSQEKDGVGV